jgi:hypothetical protein
VLVNVQGTIEEGIHNIAMEKLKLEQDVTGEGEDTTTKKKDVARLLKVFRLFRLNGLFRVIEKSHQYGIQYCSMVRWNIVSCPLDFYLKF